MSTKYFDSKTKNIISGYVHKYIFGLGCILVIIFLVIVILFSFKQHNIDNIFIINMVDI